MKTLILVRHAKSDWSQPGLPDAERCLLPKGIRRTQLVMEYLRANMSAPDLIVSSHARRAWDTAVQIAEGMGYPPSRIRKHPKIYQWNEDEMMDLFPEIPDKVNSLMVVGHNPTFTRLANFFLPEPIEWLPTTGCLSVSFDVQSWMDLAGSKSSVNFIIYPKMLKTS